MMMLLLDRSMTLVTATGSLLSLTLYLPLEGKMEQTVKALKRLGQGQASYHLAAPQQWISFRLINHGAALQVGKGKIVKVSGIQDKGKTATVLLRGSNKLVLEEAERSLHDALCVIRCLVHKRALIAGGAAPEVEMTTQLSKWAKELQVGIRLVLQQPHWL